MKQLFSLLVLMACTFTLAVAQQNDQDAAASDATQVESQDQAAGPVMTFEATVVDYGTIEQGSDPYRFFYFTNTGDEPLIIKHAKGSCGCTVPTYPKEPILPGENSEIKVRYDTKRLGKFTKSITLTTNEEEERRVLRIKGEVTKKPEEPAGVPASTGGFDN